jgi:hypothetical protein
MIKKLLVLFVICLSFASCERNSTDFDINKDIVYTVNSDESLNPWIMQYEYIHNFSRLGDKPLVNTEVTNDYTEESLSSQFRFYFAEDKTLNYNYHDINETAIDWEIIKNDELVIYTEAIEPPFDQVTYTVTKLTPYELEMSNRIENKSGNGITATKRTVLTFRRDTIK